MEKDKKYNIVLGIMIFLFILVVGAAIAWGLGIIGLKDNAVKENNSDNIKEDKLDINVEEKMVTEDDNDKLSLEDLEKIAIVTIEDYLNISMTMWSNPEEILNQLGFSQYDRKIQDIYILTDVKYAEFEERLTKYMTKELAESKCRDKYINDNGYLKILDAGASGSVYKVIKLEEIERKDNIYTYRANCETTFGDIHSEDVKVVKIKRQDNSFVVSQVVE